MNNRDTGRKAQQSGAAFERYLTALHATYAKDGRAYITRQEANAVTVRKNGKTIIVRRAVGADYAGTLAGGRSIRIEAKCYSSGARLPLEGRGCLKPLQALDLYRTAEMGGVAIVAVRVPKGDFIVPVTKDARWMGVAFAGHGPVSIPLASAGAEEWGVVGAVNDWLPTVREMIDDGVWG